MAFTRRNALIALLAPLSRFTYAQALKPNFVFILMDNLGYGEVGVYGGGITRGAPTPRIDRLASEGMRLTNFNVEAQCTPSRSALITGRFSIRSGTHSVPIGAGLDGLTRWEVTIAVDTFTTFAKIAGAQIPQNRAIDGVDQMDFFLGNSDKSNRDGFPVFVVDRLEAVKWRNWKVVFYDEQRDWWTPPVKLGTPKAFDLITDPKEEYPQTGLRETWIAGPAVRIVTEFEQSLKQYPPIAPGTPDPYTPPKSGR